MKLVELPPPLEIIHISRMNAISIQPIMKDKDKWEWRVLYKGLPAGGFFLLSDAMKNAFTLCDSLTVLNAFLANGEKPCQAS